MEKIISGPRSYANWLAFNQNNSLTEISEYPLFTDARIIGQQTEGFGPYKFINTVPIRDGPGILQPSIYLRSEFYLTNELPQMTETDSSNYHGGWFSDEIAALVSLCLGIRVKAGDASRLFKLHNDPLGRPQAQRSRNTPTISLDADRLKLPNAVGPHSLTDLEPIKVLPSLSKEQVVAFIRAARLYQDAMWIGESEPSLAWIMFVSALESGANSWYQLKDSALSRLIDSKPNLYKILNETGIHDLPEKVAGEIANSLGSANKFMKFVLNFLPDPPEKRPSEGAQVKWTKTAMREVLNKIYEYRSNALHGGIPFPAPMCEPHFSFDGCMAEKPTSLAYSTLGGTWVAEDTPMLLHIFEHITRGVLLNWLKNSVSDQILD